MKNEIEDNINQNLDADCPQNQTVHDSKLKDEDDQITDDDFVENLDDELQDEPDDEQVDDQVDFTDESDEDKTSDPENDHDDHETATEDNVDRQKQDSPLKTKVDLSKSDDTFDEDFDATFESVVEAVLFASDEPLSESRLSSIVETGSAKQIRKAVEDLNKNYEQTKRAFRIEKIAGGYQMMTLGPYNHWLRNMLRVKSDNRLSQAALETLAIIAYKQPIIRADIEAIRGVAAGEMIRSLMYKGLVKIVGRAEVLGRPMLYGTTKKFLDVFGLNSLEDLPNVEQLKKPQEKE